MSNGSLQYLNPAAFAAPAAGTFGNMPRNPVNGPGVANNDFVLAKNFKRADRYAVQFRSEFFNAFNTPQFSNPVANFSNNQFGQITQTNTSLPNRQIQFGLKVLF